MEDDAPESISVPPSGTQIGPYRLGRKLGRGAMADVVHATHVETGDVVALKLLDPEVAQRAELVSRFVREGRALHNLRHPNIVSVLDHGTTESGQAWIAMEVLEGYTVDTLLQKGGPIEIERAVRIFADVAAALARVHEHGMVHRDVKPENVFVVPEAPGRPAVAKLIDFGIAKVTRAELSASSIAHTRVGVLLGSIAFAPPEQLKGREVDPRTDVYAVGASLYEVVTGNIPFRAMTIDGQVEQKRARNMVPLSKGLPESEGLRALEALVWRCMSPVVEERPANGTELRDELLKVLAIIAPPPPVRGLSMALTLAITLVATLVIVGVLMWVAKR